jgi:hypothetical protein
VGDLIECPKIFWNKYIVYDAGKVLRILVCANVRARRTDFEKDEFLKIFISPGLDRGRGRDGDENFFLQIFFSSPSRSRSRPAPQNFLQFLPVVFFIHSHFCVDNIHK